MKSCYYPGQKIKTAMHAKLQARACSREHAPASQCARLSQFFFFFFFFWPGSISLITDTCTEWLLQSTQPSVLVSSLMIAFSFFVLKALSQVEALQKSLEAERGQVRQLQQDLEVGTTVCHQDFLPFSPCLVMCFVR